MKTELMQGSINDADPLIRTGAVRGTPSGNECRSAKWGFAPGLNLAARIRSGFVLAGRHLETGVVFLMRAPTGARIFCLGSGIRLFWNPEQTKSRSYQDGDHDSEGDFQKPVTGP